MQNKPSKNFDQIKPFLRMLEGSIDDARRRRLGRDDEAAPAPAAVAPPQRNGVHAPPVKPLAPANPLPLPGQTVSQPAASGAQPERPLRATPIKPKQSLNPSTGFRSTGS